MFFQPPLTPTLALLQSLLVWKNECFKIRKALTNVRQSCVKGLTWNGASIAIAMLDFIVILNMLNCIFRALTNIMDGQILATFNDEFAFKILIGSKCHSMQ
jgi:hypothetical protein